MPDNNSRLVFSTESESNCPECGRPLKKCGCNPHSRKKPASKAPSIPKDGTIRVMRETKGRKGKGMTMIHGVPGTMDQLKELAKELKQKCGTGGTVKDGVIEIQGDHRDGIIEELSARGYKAKKAGG